MASITKRNGGWCVQVRRKGYEARNKTFPTKSAALKWGREQEALMDGGRLHATTAPLRAKRLAELIEQYRLTVSPHKRSSETEDLRLGRIAKDPIAARVLIDLTPADFAGYRDRRLKLVKPGTVRRELYLFANMIDTATKEWGYPFPTNAVRSIAFPIANDARDRRLEDGEAARAVSSQYRAPMRSEGEGNGGTGEPLVAGRWEECKAHRRLKDERQVLGSQRIGALGTLHDAMRVPLGPLWRTSRAPPMRPSHGSSKLPLKPKAGRCYPG